MYLVQTCPNCKYNISNSDYFCPSCGRKLKDKLLSTSPAKQLTIYLISFFLPPLGIWPAIRYLKQGDKTAKKIGLAALFLTVISILLTAWISAAFINSFNKELNTQLKLYQ